MCFSDIIQTTKISEAWEDVCVSLFLVLFGGLMSGLTLGLMSLDLVELEVLQRSGSPKQQKQALAILPVIKNQHQLLVTLVLCNAIAMEALPVFLDNLFSTLVAVILSVTFVLAFGEIIPQAICSRNGLLIGAHLGWLVRILMFICFPVAYPVGKLLDVLLGHNETPLFRRSQLKAFVSIHGKEEGKGGELSHSETTIITGALDLSYKTVAEAMTPIESTFSLNIDTKMDRQTLDSILSTGHSRIPVYSGEQRNLVGVLLVKDLLSLHPENETPLNAICIRKLPSVSADTPLYDMLNEFLKGCSHMAAVVKANIIEVHKSETCNSTHDIIIANHKIPDSAGKDAKLEIGTNTCDCKVEIDHKDFQDDHEKQMNKTAQANIIGIITLEDVFEELIQEEIIDETDKYLGSNKRIRTTITTEETSTQVKCSHVNNSGNMNNEWTTAFRGKLTTKSDRTEDYDLLQPLLEERS